MSLQDPELRCKHILSGTAASVSTGLFFCLKPKTLSGKKGVQAWGEIGAHQGMAKRDILLPLVEKVVLHKDGVDVIVLPGIFGETREAAEQTLYTTCMVIQLRNGVFTYEKRIHTI